MSKLMSAALVGTLLGTGALIGAAFADQPHMQSALDHLQTAKSELEAATADKGGHRVKALELVNRAIAQTQAGIEYDRTH